MSLSTSDLSHFHIMNQHQHQHQHQHQNDHTHVHAHLPILPPPFMILNENKVNDDNTNIASITNTNKETESSSMISNPGVNVNINGAVNLNNIGSISNGTDNHALGSSEIKSTSPTNNALYNPSMNNMIMLPPLGNPYHYGSTSTPNPTSNTSSSLTTSSNSTTSTSSPTSLLPSTLPPLFKLVLDSTLPLTNYNTNVSNNNTNTASDDSSNYPLMKSYYSNLNLNKQNNYLSNPNTSPSSNPNSSLMEQNNHVNPKKRSISSSSLSPVGHSHYQSTSTQPRKKRECPICHNFFSNLTTHKSIHNKDSKPYSCSTCSRAFKRLNDLIRHEKCHLSKLGEWEFQCPFHQNSSSSNSSIDSENKNDSCHHTGYFTRCDTYKNHLKAIHFKYPPNTLKNDRFKVSGNCKECGLYFNNVQDWLINHIENNSCSKIINYNDYKKK